MSYYWTELQTIKGTVYIIASNDAIVWVGTPGSSLEKAKEWLRKKFQSEKCIKAENIILNTAKEELKNYFSGKKVQFSGPFELKGTDFQKKVWKKMSIIPFGTTVTYSDLAHSIKSPKAVRAIGMTCGLNPIAIMIPCHRVIGKNGKLTGYAGGLETKKWLLELESNNR